MAAPKTSIEFLSQEEWEKSTLGKVLKWALTIGRHIVILTELVVIVAFLSRFKLDRDLSDLGEKIKQEQAIITASADFETDFRFLQKRLAKIEDLRKNQLESAEILNELASNLPLDVVLSDFNAYGNQVSLTATSLSEIGLANFLRNLKASPRFKNLSLSQVSLESGKEVGIKFTVISDLVSK